MKKAAVIMDNGFEELEAMGPIALLRRGGMQVDLVSIPNTKEVTGRFGVTYSPAIPMKDYDFSDVDVLVIPGGPHYAKLEANPEVLKLIESFAENPEKYIAAISAAPTIQGHLGVLKDKEYLPHRNFWYYLLAFLIDMKINLSRTKTSIINQLWNVNAVLIVEK